MPEIGPYCPECHEPPLVVMFGRQAICRNGDCPVFSWDPLAPGGNPVPVHPVVSLGD